MGKMSYIHHLCEVDNKEKLIEMLGDVRMADEFINAYKENTIKNKKEKIRKTEDELITLKNELKKYTL
tara:strand:- start:1608 stop:1811 length:204 start_codon:yes stop_codon:yes gene_type:complete